MHGTRERAATCRASLCYTLAETGPRHGRNLWHGSDEDSAVSPRVFISVDPVVKFHWTPLSNTANHLDIRIEISHDNRIRCDVYRNLVMLMHGGGGGSGGA
jgi:hypothetical protein